MKINHPGAAGRLLSWNRASVALFLFASALVALPLQAAQPPRVSETRPVAVADPATEIKASALRQMDVLRSIKSNKSAVQHKIDSRLFMGILNARDDQRVRALPDFRFVRPETDGAIKVEIILSGPTAFKRVVNELENVGADVTWRSVQRTHLHARVPMDRIEQIAALAEVRRVRLPIPAMTNAINTSEGDQAHGALAARGLFGITGAGVKICVLSDGIDSLAALQASGDLPATVDVLPGQEGTGDEGSAMLEIVHDLAPDAELGFASALASDAQFAQNILDLAADGCEIIVDDIIYLNESPFQDGAIAQAVNTVTSAGVLYFSSAGNEGNVADGTSGTWEGDFLASAAADPAPLAGANLHDFGDGGNSISVEAGGADTPGLMIWAEHYDLTTGSASTDFDLYDMNGTLTTIFDASTDVQDGTGGDDFPIEFIGGGVFSGERLLVDRFAAGTTSSVPAFNLIVFRGELDDARATGGTTRGHSAAVDAYSVAATPAAASFDGVTPDGPFPGLFTTANESESFSADGPRRIILDPAGNEITIGNRTSTGGVVRQKPDITAADGVSTASPGFATFYGTSAAAPHAAAIAALLKQGDPAATPAEIRAALISTALDIETVGPDSSTGVGIIMPEAALTALGVPQVAFLAADGATPTQLVGDGDAFVEPNEDWSLDLPLQNVGGVAASAISATLSSLTPGVTVISATSAYPDLATGATASNATPYSFYVDATVGCGIDVEFELDVDYSGGSVAQQTFGYAFPTGGPGAPVTTSYAGAPVAIPDGGDSGGTLPGATVDAPIAVIATGPVYRVTMRLDGDTCSSTVGSTTVGIDHSFVNDLELTLLSPAGTEVLAVNNTDGGGNNFCQTVLDAEGGGPNIQTVVAANAPFTGNFVPNGSFDAFRGESATGNWTLRAQDFFLQDTGNIRAWSVTVTPAICDAPPQTVDVAASKTVSGVFVEGGSIVYTVTLTNTGNGLQQDNAGDEFTDTLPAGLTLGTPTATSGTVSTAGVNPVTWNGTVPAGGSVTITIPATVNAGTADSQISNQGTVNVDTQRDGTNETAVLTDDPAVGGSADATVFTVLQGELQITPMPVDFGNVEVGNEATSGVTLANIGSNVLSITAIDAPTAPFTQDPGGCGSLPLSIAAGASCTITYRFAPTASGPADDDLAVTVDVPGDAAISLQGNGIPGPIAITPAVLPRALIDAEYSVQLEASGVGTTNTFSFSQTGSLPAGLTLAADGLLSGTPSALGTFNFTVTATDDSDIAVGGPFSESIDYVLVVVDEFIFADGFEDLEVLKFELKSMSRQQVELPLVGELARSDKDGRQPVALLTMKGVTVGVVEARCAARECEVRVAMRAGNAKWNAGPWQTVDADPFVIDVEAGATLLRRIGPVSPD